MAGPVVTDKLRPEALVWFARSWLIKAQDGDTRAARKAGEYLAKIVRDCPEVLAQADDLAEHLAGVMVADDPKAALLLKSKKTPFSHLAHIYRDVERERREIRQNKVELGNLGCALQAVAERNNQSFHNIRKIWRRCDRAKQRLREREPEMLAAILARLEQEGLLPRGTEKAE